MDAEALHQKLDKSFYDDLPSMICELLDDLIDKYAHEPWFIKAFNEYRDYCNNTEIQDLRMPGYIKMVFSGKQS